MKVCAVQYRAVKGDAGGNIRRHVEFARLAAEKDGDVVFFPELSLTGYEPQLAKELAMDAEDARLDVLQRCSDEAGIVICAGLPLSAENGVRIGMVWLSPNAPRHVYAKQMLHTDELPYFIPGAGQLVLEVKGAVLAPAICFESLQPAHAEQAAALGASVYLASVAKPAGGVARAAAHYPEIARRHGMHVVMANSVGPSDHFVSVGKSAAWNSQGELLAQMDAESEGMVVFDGECAFVDCRSHFAAP